MEYKVNRRDKNTLTSLFLMTNFFCLCFKTQVTEKSRKQFTTDEIQDNLHTFKQFKKNKLNNIETDILISNVGAMPAISLVEWEDRQNANNSASYQHVSKLKY